MVLTTGVYTYIGLLAKVLNEGLLRAVWVVVSDGASRTETERLRPLHTVILFQAALGLLISVVSTAAAPRLTDAFVPAKVSARFAANIALDLLFVSRFRVASFRPTVNAQGAVRLACDVASASTRVACFLWRAGRGASGGSDGSDGSGSSDTTAPSLRALGILVHPGALAPRVARAGRDDASVHLTRLRQAETPGPGWRDADGGGSRYSLKPAAKSLSIALVFEISPCIFLSPFGARPLARYPSGIDAVADVTAYMWRTIDWCYILYAMSTLLAGVLLATRPKWYLYQSLVSNLFYLLPCAIVSQVAELDASYAWAFHSPVFGGSLVFSFVDIVMVDAIRAWTL
ncbi:hypothetical protein DL768_010999 [Monosporascus sp. mg162]|nr:hypothetical protein DL768_010999 [Monosporascus sp. mg162]